MDDDRIGRVDPARDRTPHVTAVVVGYNHVEWLEQCLSTLLASTHPALSVVYVENASSDGSAAFVRSRLPDVEVVALVKNTGFAGGNNAVLERAVKTSDYVFLVNPDTRTPPGLVAALVAFMDAHPDYGVVGPLQYAYGDPARLNEWSESALTLGEQHEFAHRVPQPSNAGGLAGRAPNTLEHPYVQGAALFARSAVLRAAGLFDPAYHSYYEELDLCRRVRWCGYRVALLLDLGIEHAGDSGGMSRRRAVLMTRNRYYYLWTDPTWSLSDSLRLTWSWARSDAAKAKSVLGARGAAEVLAGLAARLPAVARRRRANRALAKEWLTSRR